MKESLAYQEILEEGATNNRRGYILEVIADRFGKKAANAFRGPLKAIDDPKRLDRLFRTARHCSSLDELREAVDAR